MSDFHPLIPDEYLIIYLNKKLCIAQIISIYEKQGQQHAWIAKADFWITYHIFQLTFI